MTNPMILRVDALAVADGDGFCASPGSLLVQVRDVRPEGEPGPMLLAAGSTREVDAHPGAASSRVIARPRWVLLPGLVNSHAHLDLTQVGPLEHDPGEGFVAWVERVRAARATGEAEIAASVGRGVGLSLAGGVVAVGDIAGCPASGPSLAPWRALVDCCTGPTSMDRTRTVTVSKL